MSKAGLASLAALALALVGGARFWIASRDAGPDPARARGAASEETRGADDESAGKPQPDEQLARRVASLEARVARLEQSAGIARAAASTGDDEAADDPSVVDDPVFEAAVRDVVDRVESEQERQRREQRQRRMEVWARETAGELSEKLELDDTQRGRIQSMLGDHFARILELRDTASRSDGGQSPRARYAAARDDLDRKIDEVLTPAQQKEAEALRETGEFPGRWGRGRR